MIASILSKTRLATVIPALPPKQTSVPSPKRTPDNPTSNSMDTPLPIITDVENLQELPHFETESQSPTEAHFINVSRPMLDDAEAVPEIAEVLDPSTKRSGGRVWRIRYSLPLIYHCSALLLQLLLPYSFIRSQPISIRLLAVCFLSHDYLLAYKTASSSR